MLSDCYCESWLADCALETHEWGVALGRKLQANAVVALFGDLGAGKTTFVRGLVEGCGCADSKIVTSPTFNWLNIYEGSKMVYHFDLYRLPRPEEFFAAGFHEHFTAGGICCIEWAEKLGAELPKEAIAVTLTYIGEESRQLHIKWGSS